MLKSFDEFVTERLFNGGMNRSQLGKLRKEDELDRNETNLYDLKEVDLGLPFVFSNACLFLSETSPLCTYGRIQDVMPAIRAEGWRLPTQDDIQLLKDSKDFIECRGVQIIEAPDEIHRKFYNGHKISRFCIHSNKTNQDLHLLASTSHDAKTIYMTNENGLVWLFNGYASRNSKNYHISLPSFTKYYVDEMLFVILVKDKNEPISERLFNTGIKRANQNTIRKEERLSDTNLYDLEPVDLGLPFVFAHEDLMVNNTVVFGREEYFSELKDYIDASGWRLMTEDECEKYIINNEDLVSKTSRLKHIKSTKNKKYPKSDVLKIEMRDETFGPNYLLQQDDNELTGKLCVFGPGHSQEPEGWRMKFFKWGNFELLQIRLVRDK